MSVLKSRTHVVTIHVALLPKILTRWDCVIVFFDKAYGLTVNAKPEQILPVWKYNYMIENFTKQMLSCYITFFFCFLTHILHAAQKLIKSDHSISEGLSHKPKVWLCMPVCN